MKQIIYLSLLLLSITTAGFTAKAGDIEGSGHDFGFSFGPNFALTDLGGAKKIGSPFIRDIDFKATRFCVSAFYRYNVNKWLAVRGNLMYGMLSADDNNTDGRPPRYENGTYVQPDDSWYRARRNLNFTTHIFEFQAMAEVNLKKYMHDAAGGDKERWAPYVGGGLGFFYFNPYTKLDGKKVKLKPLGTEGQNIPSYNKKPYSNFQFDLIAMVGIKYNVTERFSIALEGVYHQTFTDYLDDVSGSYINPQDISKLSHEGQILQNRANSGRYPSDEFNQIEGQRSNNINSLSYGLILPTGTGEQRGDKKDNDQFLHVQLTFTFSLGAGGSKLGFGSCGKRNPYHHKFACPKW
jgi:hypothetical protein